MECMVLCEGIVWKCKGVMLDGDRCWKRWVLRRESGCWGSWFRIGVWEYWVGSKGGGSIWCWEE